jgi:hypothetical protein
MDTFKGENEMRRIFWLIAIVLLLSNCLPPGEQIVPISPPDPVDISQAIIIVVPYQTGIVVTWSRINDADCYLVHWTQGKVLGWSAYWGAWSYDPTNQQDIQHAQSDGVEYMLPGTTWYLTIYVYHQIDRYTISVIYTYSAGPITIP